MSAAPRETPRRLEDFLHVAQVGHERQEIAVDARAAEARQREEIVVAGARHGLPELTPRLGARADGEAPRATALRGARYRGNAALLHRHVVWHVPHVDKEVAGEKPAAAHEPLVAIDQTGNAVDHGSVSFGSCPRTRRSLSSTAVSPTSTIDTLRRVAYFRSLPARELARLAPRCRHRSLKRGERAFDAGETCRGLLVVAEGAVEMRQVSSRGREQVLH